MTSIGVVIPSLNGGPRFVECLAALAQQDTPPATLVVVDSDSSDGSAAAARETGAKVIPIAREDFDHGASRSLGAEHAGAVDVLVFLVQDAVPTQASFLDSLARAVLQPDVAAATARQRPPHDASPLTAATVCSSPFASDQARVTGPFTPEQVARFTPAQWRARLLLDDVACAVRADVFRAVGGYAPGPHGEDVLLAFDLLMAGWALGHEPAALVEHGHEYDEQTVRPRYLDDAAFFRTRFGFRARPSALSCLKGWAAEVRRDSRWLARHPEHDSAGLRAGSRRLRWAQVSAQREGSRGPLGRLPTPRPCPRPDEVAGGMPDGMTGELTG